jgi:twitching motility protein PilT
MDLNEILSVGLKSKASDIHLKAGLPPIYRIDGTLRPLPKAPRISPEMTEQIAQQIMNDLQKERFEKAREVDLAYGVPGLGRFRVNVFSQRGSISLVFRAIPFDIKDVDELMLPPVVKKLGKKSIINQREIGSDTEGFQVALKSALRQDPDVILVGEMRDHETIETAIMAAETGHLVLSTLHTVDATETVNRIISVFPPYQQRQIRIQLAAVLKGVISMRLVPKADGKGRVPAVEVMVSTARVRQMIDDKDLTKSLPEVIQQGYESYGMQTFDQSLMALLKNKQISFEEALRQASNPDDFKLKISGVSSTSDLTWDAFEGMDDEPTDTEE